MPKERISKTMQAVKSSGSKIEVMLAKALWTRGFRYRKNDRSVFGKPDLTFKKLKLAIFVDSEFWHGKDWERTKHDHKTNKIFWHNKIERNIMRDVEVNKYLFDEGWTVLRFWGNDIEKRLDYCLNKIEIVIQEKRDLKKDMVK